MCVCWLPYETFDVKWIHHFSTFVRKQESEEGQGSKGLCCENSWSFYHNPQTSWILSPEKSRIEMALRQTLGWSEGEVMRPESKPCSRLMRQTSGIFSVGSALAFWVLCRLHYGHNSYQSSSPIFSIFVEPFYAWSLPIKLSSSYRFQVNLANERWNYFTAWQHAYSVGPRITLPRSLRWASCGAISVTSTSALLVRLFSPECEPQNIAAYDIPEHKAE